MHDGHTIYIQHCDECPRVWDWPVRSMITGQCPRCGKLDPRAWRFAAARRILLRREREAAASTRKDESHG